MKKKRKKIDIKAGREIRKRRKRLGVPMGYLAERIGKTQQQLQKYESAKDRISLSAASDIAKALEVTIILTMEGDIIFRDGLI